MKLYGKTATSFTERATTTHRFNAATVFVGSLRAHAFLFGKFATSLHSSIATLVFILSSNDLLRAISGFPSRTFEDTVPYCT